jgi:hypothetical protein
MNSEIRHCTKMLCQERRLARTAPCREVAEVHEQMAMLYSAQLNLLRLQQTPLSDRESTRPPFALTILNALAYKTC